MLEKKHTYVLCFSTSTPDKPPLVMKRHTIVALLMEILALTDFTESSLEFPAKSLSVDARCRSVLLDFGNTLLACTDISL